MPTNVTFFMSKRIITSSQSYPSIPRWARIRKKCNLRNPYCLPNATKAKMILTFEVIVQHYLLYKFSIFSPLFKLRIIMKMGLKRSFQFQKRFKFKILILLISIVAPPRKGHTKKSFYHIILEGLKLVAEE